MNRIKYERQADGTYVKSGEVSSRYVNVQVLRDGVWSWPTRMNRKHIMSLIEATGARLSAEAYSLVEIASELSEEDKARLKALKAKKEEAEEEAHE